MKEYLIALHEQWEENNICLTDFAKAHGLTRADAITLILMGSKYKNNTHTGTLESDLIGKTVCQ